MNENDFLLYLNANNIPYRVCKILQGKIGLFNILCVMLKSLPYHFILENEITAKDFNLKSFESWSLYLKSLAPMEKDVIALQALLGM